MILRAVMLLAIALLCMLPAALSQNGARQSPVCAAPPGLGGGYDCIGSWGSGADAGFACSVCPKSCTSPLCYGTGGSSSTFVRCSCSKRVPSPSPISRPTVKPTIVPSALPTRPSPAPTTLPTRPTAKPTLAPTPSPTPLSFDRSVWVMNGYSFGILSSCDQACKSRGFAGCDARQAGTLGSNAGAVSSSCSTFHSNDPYLVVMNTLGKYNCPNLGYTSVASDYCTRSLKYPSNRYGTTTNPYGTTMIYPLCACKRSSA